MLRYVYVGLVLRRVAIGHGGHERREIQVSFHIDFPLYVHFLHSMYVQVELGKVPEMGRFAVRISK